MNEHGSCLCTRRLLIDFIRTGSCSTGRVRDDVCHDFCQVREHPAPRYRQLEAIFWGCVEKLTFSRDHNSIMSVKFVVFILIIFPPE